MAILNRGFDQVNLHGSVGAVTYRRVDGRTIASQKVAMKSSAKRTRSVMLQRMKWANLVALWKVLNVPGWHPSFPKEDVSVSDFNNFMSANLQSAGIYLPRGLQRSGAGVVARTKVTEGSLLPIDVEFNNNIAESDLALGTLSIGNSTTLGAFSQAIIANNSGWQDGDMLTVVIVRQLSIDGMPSLSSVFLQVKLNSEDATTLLSDVVDVTLLTVADGCLALSSSLTGGCAMVHSRRLSDGSTAVSRQYLVPNNTAIIATYTGNSAFVAAAESYGGIAQEEYLTPYPDDEVATDLNP